MNRAVLLVVFLLIAYSCNKKLILYKEGNVAFKYYESDMNQKLGKILPSSEQLIWFKDSVVIMERKMMDQYYENDSITRRINKLIGFTYLDLKNMRCQDYLKMHDTAKPVTNYRLTDKEFLCFGFYILPKPFKASQLVFPSKDTVIGDKKFKMVRVFNKLDSSGYEYYLQKRLSDNIFHLNAFLDNSFPEFQVVKIIFYYNVLSKRVSVTEINFIADSLSKQQNAIFKQWENNSRNTSLPTSSMMNAIKNLLEYQIPDSNFIIN
jgi:hypothetical protein